MGNEGMRDCNHVDAKATSATLGHTERRELMMTRRWECENDMNAKMRSFPKDDK